MTITQRNDIWTIGDHKLMCASSADPIAIDHLFGASRPDLVFTSPPYANLRTYLTFDDSKWDDMMNTVFDAVPHHANTQIIVNLGLVHKHNELVWYFNDWLSYMRVIGWRNYGMYIWDKIHGMCGNWHGRLAPSFELLFHFNKSVRQPNKTKAKKPENISERRSSFVRERDGHTRPKSSPLAHLNTHKIPDSVVRMLAERANRKTPFGNHPAVFPITLPAEFIAAYTNENEMVFDPFVGSGTTIIAANGLNRRGYGMEIEPHYCDIAISRIQAETGLLAYRQDGETFDYLCHPDFFASRQERVMAEVIDRGAELFKRLALS